jgi:hypothetical protein
MYMHTKLEEDFEVGRNKTSHFLCQGKGEDIKITYLTFFFITTTRTLSTFSTCMIYVHADETGGGFQSWEK